MSGGLCWSVWTDWDEEALGIEGDFGDTYPLGESLEMSACWAYVIGLSHGMVDVEGGEVLSG